MNPDLRHLRAFAAVAREGGFTRAARRLRSTQPALTLLVRQLEEALGARLFDRDTRNVRLTATGAQLLPAVERLLADLEATIGGVREAVARARGRVVVAVLPSIASSLLPAAIAAVRAANPEVEVAVRDAVEGRIAAMVRTGEADFGLAGLPAADGELEFAPLATDRLVAVCPQAHRLARRSRMAWKDVVGERFISMGRDSSVRRLVEQAFAAVGRRLEPAYEVVYLSSAVAMAAAGLGIAVVPSSALGALDLERVAVRPIGNPAVIREIGILTSRGKSLSPAAQFLAQALRKAAVRR